MLALVFIGLIPACGAFESDEEWRGRHAHNSNIIITIFVRYLIYSVHILQHKPTSRVSILASYVGFK